MVNGQLAEAMKWVRPALPAPPPAPPPASLGFFLYNKLEHTSAMRVRVSFCVVCVLFFTIWRNWKSCRSTEQGCSKGGSSSSNMVDVRDMRQSRRRKRPFKKRNFIACVGCFVEHSEHVSCEFDNFGVDTNLCEPRDTPAARFIQQLPYMSQTLFLSQALSFSRPRRYPVHPPIHNLITNAKHTAVRIRTS